MYIYLNLQQFVLIVLFVICTVVGAVVYWRFVQRYVKVKDVKAITRIQAYVINLERNQKRLQQFNTLYYKSDISAVPLERFEAVNGREIDVQGYLTESAYKQVLLSESSGYREKHYQLTRGGVGCYLSHMTLYYKLVDDEKHDFYVIFEDDCVFGEDMIEQIQLFLEILPKNWDMLVLGTIHSELYKTHNIFVKYRTFWGLFGYIINKRGAKKIIREYEAKKIDKQIDSMLSVMTVNNRLNVYGLIRPLVRQDSTFGTDIQLPVKPTTGIDPFILEDFVNSIADMSQKVKENFTNEFVENFTER